MTIASNGRSSNGSVGNRDAVLSALLDGLQTGTTQEAIEALKNRAPSSPALQAVIDQAGLRPEQTLILNLLMALEAGHGATNVRAEEVEPQEAQGPVPTTGSGPLRAIKRELADLREVNDTVAAALGACRICWGGDEECKKCEGCGRPGCFEPHRALFDQLVIPAIRRARR